MKFSFFKKRKNKNKEQYKQIGKNVQICDASNLHHKEKIVIGDNVYVGGNASIWGIGGLQIGDNTILGPRVTIHTSNHRYENADFLPYDGTTYIQSVVIGRNVWIGDSAMICPGVKVGDGAVVGMGSVVSRDVPVGAVVAGNPAKVIKMRDMVHYNELDNNGKYYLDAKTKGRIEHQYVEKTRKYM